MNKRISTLFASFLLMAGAVFAAGETTPAKTYEALDKVTNGERCIWELILMRILKLLQAF